MAISKTLAQEYVRVVVDRAFSIVIPAGMTYSTDKAEINSNRQLCAISTRETELFRNHFGDESDYSLSNPFAAPRCLTVMDPKQMGAMDLSAPETKDLLRQLATQLYSAMLGQSMRLEVPVDRDDIMCIYGIDSGEFDTCAQVMIVVPTGIYSGQVWVNDEEGMDRVEAFCRQLLCSVEPYTLAEEDKVPAPAFVAPTYAQGKRAQVLTLTFGVPDGMITLAEEAEKAENLGTMAAFKALESSYDFLAIPADFDGGFNRCNDAPFSINVRSGNATDQAVLDTLWGQGAEAVLSTVSQILKNNLTQSGRYFDRVEEKVLGERLCVTYALSGESTDPVEYWRSYLFLVVHNTSLIAFNVFINASQADAEQFLPAVEDWLATMAPASAEEAAAAQEAKRRKDLAGWLAEDGKIDAVKVSQLFTKDVVFNNDNEILYDGTHHTMIGMQFNSQVLGDYPQIQQGMHSFGMAIKDVVAFVEQNEHLMIPKERFHKNLLAATRNRSITGISVFDLCAWHLITITSLPGSNDDYLVALGQDLIRGLPEGYKYIAEFIATLRAYNGITGPFKVQFASTMVLDSPCDYIEQPVPGACVANGLGDGFPEVAVAEGEHPYAGVLEGLDKGAEEEKAAYEQAMEEWKSTKAQAETQRREWVEAEVAKLRADLEQKAKAKLDRAEKDWTYRLEQHRQRRAQAEQTLAGLGMLKFAEKKAQRQIIEECTAGEAECANWLTKARESYQSDCADIDRQVYRERDALEQQAAELYPIPTQPRKPQSLVEAEKQAARAGMTEIQRQNEDIKDIILEVLSDGALYTVEDLQCAHPRLMELSNQRVSALTRQLVTSGLVERVEERRKAYFRII